jgi:hypothetical protein
VIHKESAYAQEHYLRLAADRAIKIALGEPPLSIMELADRYVKAEAKDGYGPAKIDELAAYLLRVSVLHHREAIATGEPVPIDGGCEDDIDARNYAHKQRRRHQ